MRSRGWPERGITLSSLDAVCVPWHWRINRIGYTHCSQGEQRFYPGKFEKDKYLFRIVTMIAGGYFVLVIMHVMILTMQLWRIVTIGMVPCVAQVHHELHPMESQLFRDELMSSALVGLGDSRRIDILSQVHLATISQGLMSRTSM